MNRFAREFMEVYNLRMSGRDVPTDPYDIHDTTSTPEVKVVTDHITFRNTPLAHAREQAWLFKHENRNDPNFHVIDEREDTVPCLTVHITYTHSEKVW